MKTVKQVSSKYILDFALKFFPNFKIDNSPFKKNYVYESDGKIIGFISFSIIYERAELDYIAVLEEYRGMGIASRLFDKLIIEASRCLNITLEVRCDNDRAISFYLKKGFKIVGKREKYYDGIDAYLMIKEIEVR